MSAEDRKALRQRLETEFEKDHPKPPRVILDSSKSPEEFNPDDVTAAKAFEQWNREKNSFVNPRYKEGVSYKFYSLSIKNILQIELFNKSATQAASEVKLIEEDKIKLIEQFKSEFEALNPKP